MAYDMITPDDKKQAFYDALIRGGLKVLSAPPSSVPRGSGAYLAEGLGAGMDAYGSSLDAMRKEKMLNMQIEEALKKKRNEEQFNNLMMESAGPVQFPLPQNQSGQWDNLIKRPGTGATAFSRNPSIDDAINAYVQSNQANQAIDLMLKRPVAKAPTPDLWDSWGHGQRRNRRTGDIEKVPVDPSKSKDSKALGNKTKAAFAYMKSVLKKPNEYGTIQELDSATARKATLHLDRLVKQHPNASPQRLGELAIQQIETMPAPSAAPGYNPTQEGGSGFGAELSGNKVMVQGKAYNLNPDGTVTINGQKFKVNR